jgi:hypothetical protein
MSDVTKTDHGHLFDTFSASASHAHGGSYFDAGFGLQTIRDAHGKLYDRFGVPRDSSAHGERFDNFGWHDMPALHGQQFDSDFQTPTGLTGEHGTWFDAFRGGTEVRFMLEGADYEGTVIDCNPQFARVRSHDGQTHEVELAQFLAFRSPTQEQASPSTPASDAEAPSAHSADAHGAFGGDRAPVPTGMPSVIETARPGEHTDQRSSLPEGLQDTFLHLKTLANEIDVEKISVGGKACPHCGHDTFKIPPAGSAKTVTCNGCGAAHRFSDVAGHTITPAPRPTPGGIRGQGSAFGKSVDSTETATQGAAVETVGHRSNCPRGGSAPCGAAVEGRCTICKAQVHDHEAVGKANTGDLAIEVPEREHKSTDHHSNQRKPRRCPHCGGALDELDHQTEQGQPSRTHKCLRGSLDVLKTAVEA